MPDRAAERRFDRFMEVVDAGSVSDGVVGFYRATDHPGRIVGVGMHNFRNSKRITERQAAMVRFAIQELRGLGERGHLPLPPVARSHDLPPRLRQLLDRLIAGQNPKAISRQLGLSIHTVREPIGRIYKHFDVSGRDELMAKFVRN